MIALHHQERGFMSVVYEMSFKTEGYPWRVYNTYKSRDDPKLLEAYKTYSNHRIITDVRIVEITTTRKVINGKAK